jgi:hypothetical protein
MFGSDLRRGRLRSEVTIASLTVRRGRRIKYIEIPGGSIDSLPGGGEREAAGGQQLSFAGRGIANHDTPFPISRLEGCAGGGGGAEGTWIRTTTFPRRIRSQGLKEQNGRSASAEFDHPIPGLTCGQAKGISC